MGAMSDPVDWEAEEERLLQRAAATGDATGWFDDLYAAGASGRVQVPWSRTEPHPLLEAWAGERHIDGTGLSAIVVGCALGADAEYLARLRFETTGFDVAPTAIELARARHPDTRVRYVTADILDPPAEWHHAFDLVVEIITVQALPPPLHPRAIANIGRLVAAGGTLLVISGINDGQPRTRLADPDTLDRAAVASFAADGLEEVSIETRAVPGRSGRRRWLAEFTRRSPEPRKRSTTTEATMSNAHDNQQSAETATPDTVPAVVERATFQAQLDALRVEEKAHTRAGDALAAARRRLPMVEVDAATPLIGPHGPVTLLDVFEGRRQLIGYYHMWYDGRPAKDQCEGCTLYNGQVRELSMLHSRDVTYATLCQGPYEESVRYRDFMGWDVPWYSAQQSLDTLLIGRQIGLFHVVCYVRHGDRVFETYWTTGRGDEALDNSYGLLDLTVYGRQEPWEDSPAGWPQAKANMSYRTNGRPYAQWSRIQAGRSDNLGGA